MSENPQPTSDSQHLPLEEGFPMSRPEDGLSQLPPPPPPPSPPPSLPTHRASSPTGLSGSFPTCRVTEVDITVEEFGAAQVQDQDRRQAQVQGQNPRRDILADAILGATDEELGDVKSGSVKMESESLLSVGKPGEVPSVRSEGSFQRGLDDGQRFQPSQSAHDEDLTPEEIEKIRFLGGLPSLTESERMDAGLYEDPPPNQLAVMVAPQEKSTCSIGLFCRLECGPSPA